MSDDSHIWKAARHLYAQPLGDFVKARNEQVRLLKRAGADETAQQVAAFTKPSAAADLVNRLIRQDPDLLEEIDRLGHQLRATHEAADPAAARELDRRRRELVSRCAVAARDLARSTGKAATDSTLRDVEQTVWAAVIDAHAAATLRAGVLVRPLSAGGFGEIDVTGASALEVEAPAASAQPARPRRARSSAAPARPTADVRRAERQALAQAQAAAQASQHDLELAAAAADAAQEQLAALQERRDSLRAELTRVEGDLKAARRLLSERRATLKLAERQRRVASAEVDRSLRAFDAR